MKAITHLAMFLLGIIFGAKATEYIVKAPPPQKHPLLQALQHERDLQDYQVKLTFDSAIVYQYGSRIGATLPGKDGIDSVIKKDNE